jgi:hypothetical protein
MNLPVMLDVSRVVVNFLRAQPELAEPLEGRIYTILPAQPVWPALRCTRWGGYPAINRPLILDASWAQVDIWGEQAGKFAVSELANLARALITYRLVPECNAQGITAVGFGMMHDAPDQTYHPARPHYRFDINVFIKASRAGVPGPASILEAAVPSRAT